MTVPDTKQTCQAHQPGLIEHSITTRNKETKSTINFPVSHRETHAPHIIDVQ